MSILAGAYGGANRGRGIRRSLDAGGSFTHALVLVVCLGFGGAFGVGFGWSVAHANPLGAAICGLVLAGSAQIGTQAGLRIWWKFRRVRHAQPVLAAAPSGARATAYLRPAAALAGPVVTATLLTSVGLGTTWAAAQDANWWAAALAVLGTAYAASTVLPFVLRKTAAGGLYLTGSGLEHRYGLSSALIAWDAAHLERAGSVLRARGTSAKSFPWFIPIEPADRDTRGTVAIPTAYLGPSTGQILTTIESCQRDPVLRSALGTLTGSDLATPPGIVEL